MISASVIRPHLLAAKNTFRLSLSCLPGTGTSSKRPCQQGNDFMSTNLAKDVDPLRDTYHLIVEKLQQRLTKGECKRAIKEEAVFLVVAFLDEKPCCLDGAQKAHLVNALRMLLRRRGTLQRMTRSELSVVLLDLSKAFYPAVKLSGNDFHVSVKVRANDRIVETFRKVALTSIQRVE